MLQNEISIMLNAFDLFQQSYVQPRGYIERFDFKYLLENRTDDLPKENEEYDLSESPVPSRLDNLASFAILGIDIKITPQGEVKVIEINGANSGMKGFAKVGVDYDPSDNPSTTDLSLMCFDTSYFFRNLSCLDRNPCEEALEQHLQSYGKKQLEFIGEKFREIGFFSRNLWRFPAKKVSRKDTYSFFPEFDIESGFGFDYKSRYDHIARTLHEVEEALEDKLVTDELFDDSSENSKVILRSFKPRTRVYDEKGLQELIAENPEYVVIKPKDGYRGEGISIVKLADLNQSEHPFNPSHVIEPFIPSKYIFSEQTNSYHDGCMRYVILVEETKFGKINVFHFGGYWRLSPKPIADYGDLESMRANLAQGAIPQKASNQELNVVRSAVNSFVPVFYENLMHHHGTLSHPRLCQRLEALNDQISL